MVSISSSATIEEDTCFIVLMMILKSYVLINAKQGL